MSNRVNLSGIQGFAFLTRLIISYFIMKLENHKKRHHCQWNSTLGLLFLLLSSSVVSPALWTPWTAACQASLSFTHVRWVVMPSNYLILCCLLFLLPSIFLRVTSAQVSNAHLWGLSSNAEACLQMHLKHSFNNKYTCIIEDDSTLLW